MVCFIDVIYDTKIAQRNYKLVEKSSAAYIGPYITALERIFDLYMKPSTEPFGTYFWLILAGKWK